MTEETITGRINRNILDLLQTLTTQECINTISKIKLNFETQTLKTTNLGTTRQKYINIYITHTQKRIENLRQITNEQQFRLILYKEKLENTKHIPINISHKYRKLILSES